MNNSNNNAKKCPRFEKCNIAKCPLDEDMFLRAEMPEDEICVLRGENRGSRKGGSLTTQMRGLLNFVLKKNESSDKNRF